MFSFEEFVSRLHSDYSDRFTYAEIRNLVFLDDFEKDSPHSLGKSLVIRKIKFKGQKNNGEKIDYEKIFLKGVNVIFADNGKGKSSLFKILKFALTGDKSSIKKDVLNWLHEIFLEFNIGNVTYTTYINLLGNRTFSGLYRVQLEKVLTYREQKISLESHQIQFEANTDRQFKAEMEDFFLNELSYYNLKWTSGNKNSIDLIENQTTWKTYYKSIYLESKDYNVLFINEDYGQGKKILEMLLGLQLTFAINSLTLKRDYLANQLKKQEFVLSTQEKPEKNVNINNKLSEIDKAIELLKHNQKKAFQKSSNLNEYNDLIMGIKNLDDELMNLRLHKEEMEKQENQLIKQINRLEEELNFGMFFSNLEVKVCPRCEHDVKPEKKYIEKDQHKCMLCENDMSEIDEVQKEVIEFKLEELTKQLQKFKKGNELLLKESIIKEEEKLLLVGKLAKVEKEFNTVEFTDRDIESLTNLIEKKLELEYQLRQSEMQDQDLTVEKLDDRISVLNAAISYLVTMRIEMSKSILLSLETLILNQLHIFGLTSVTDVFIKDSLEIKYLQNNELTKFSELNEGEQLRAKIAFFISLIKLDIKFSVGRHPRLLIIDSPGKEEVISKDLEGLSTLFNQIEKDYGEDLQIIIGTALEPLKNASVDEKIDSRKPGISVF